MNATSGDDQSSKSRFLPQAKGLQLNAKTAGTDAAIKENERRLREESFCCSSSDTTGSVFFDLSSDITVRLPSHAVSAATKKSRCKTT